MDMHVPSRTLKMSQYAYYTPSCLKCDNMLSHGYFPGQCVSLEVVCDVQKDCVDGSDEAKCVYDYNGPAIYRTKATPPPAVVNFDITSLTSSLVTVTALGKDSDPCPESHFQCANNGYCLPFFLRCNGVSDCPDHEDELQCKSYTCPGFYRCRESKVCLHATHVCDRDFQCPQQDDELFCQILFPDNCKCHGLACTCNVSFDAWRFRQLRYLDALDSGLTQTELVNNTMLVYIGLMRCKINTMEHFIFPNLHTLDLRQNSLKEISITHFASMPTLRNLFLSSNPISFLFHDRSSEQGKSLVLEWLDLSHIVMGAINSSVLSDLPKLFQLNLSNTGIQYVHPNTFQVAKKLKVLDVRGCPMTSIPGDLFHGLKHLQSVVADNYKLCCPAMLPAGFDLNHCQAPANEISSCDDLLRSEVYRIVLSAVAVVTFLGNVITFVSRLFMMKPSKQSGYVLFVINLSMSDFLMGIYLAMIGLADQRYRDSYLWEDSSWRHSSVCYMAGFLSLLSSEVSAMIICLITLDRFIVLRFPFSSLRFGKRASAMLCVAVWVVGVVIATVPFTTSWEFYSQTGICIPLPITRIDFQGHQYAFAVMIILNFVLFLLITTGQAFIFLSIRSSRMATADSTRKSQDVRIARGLITIVVSDFLCWFPIGLLGLLASRGTRVPGEANVAMAIIVLPLNSALNPFLYNLNMILQRRQKAREDGILQTVMAQIEDRHWT